MFLTLDNISEKMKKKLLKLLQEKNSNTMLDVALLHRCKFLEDSETLETPRNLPPGYQYWRYQNKEGGRLQASSRVENWVDPQGRKK